jgi:threonine dehydratase
MNLPTIDDIRNAAAQIRPYAVRTPLIESDRLNDRLGGRVLLKLELLQRTGTFKFRGACNKISRLSKTSAPGGVVAVSSGNHAQGVADAARMMGLQAAIVMPSQAPALKIARTKALGAEIIPYDRETGDREGIFTAVAKARGAVKVPPFDDPEIMAGQGTVGLEICEQAAAMGAAPGLVLVPCGGGGLVSGVATAVRALHPSVRVMAIEPEGFDDTTRSLASGRHESNTRRGGSICDALLSPEPGVLTLAACLQHSVSGAWVSEKDVRAAMRYAFEELKLVVEPGGAVGLAALLSGRVPVDAQCTVVVLSGGNVDPAMFAEIISER